MGLLLGCPVGCDVGDVGKLEGCDEGRREGRLLCDMATESTKAKRMSKKGLCMAQLAQMQDPVFWIDVPPALLPLRRKPNRMRCKESFLSTIDTQPL